MMSWTPSGTELLIALSVLIHVDHGLLETTGGYTTDRSVTAHSSLRIVLALLWSYRQKTDNMD